MKRFFSLDFVLAALAPILLSGFAFAKDIVAELPHPPKTFQVPYHLPSGGATYHVKQGDNLQTIINNAALGDVIILDAGATFTGNFKLPNKTSGSGWIYIISSDIASLPEGKRVGPADAAHMPKIISPNANPAIGSVHGTHHYRFSGIEVSTASKNYNLILLGYENGVNPATLEDLSHYMIFDRCYIHSTSESNWARTGISLNATYGAVVDSYISNFKDGSDSQAIVSYYSAGPLKIVNNYLESTGENFMSGGTSLTITHNTDPTNFPAEGTGVVLADIEFRNNYCYKPLKWKYDAPSYAGYNWTIKNLFELKMAERVLVDGNIFENAWEVVGQRSDGQRGTAIVLTIRNSANEPWAVLEDITFSNNIIRHVGFGMRITGENGPIDTLPSQQTKRILIKNNLFEDINQVYFDNARGIGFSTAYPVEGFDGPWPVLDATIQNNLFLHAEATAGTDFIDFDGDQVAAENLVYENNITTHAGYGIKGNGTNDGMSTLNKYTINPTIQNNVIICRPIEASYADTLAHFNTIYPANNLRADGIANVGFTDYANGDYRLTVQSAYHNAGTDGKDIGPDWDALNKATRGVIDGHRDANNLVWVSRAANLNLFDHKQWSRQRAPPYIKRSD